MLDIRKRAVAETATFDLLDANDEPLLDDDGNPCRCTIYGPGSRRFAQAQQAKSDKLMAKVVRGQAARFTGDEQARTQAEFLAAITESIDLEYDGLEGHKKFVAIYLDTSIGFIAEQVSKKAGDWGNFKKGSANS